jgi:catechol 2,3-dioxygenase-like lactoylglutathione lyase family enzyme
MRADRGAGEKSSRRTVWFVITGAHVIVYSSDAEADRAFFQDVLQYPSVDAGGGWLIFKLPPAEVAVHPAEGAGTHGLYLMCDDVNATVNDLKAKGVMCGQISDEGWGLLTSIRLPGGGDLGLYQPRHPKATEL